MSEKISPAVIREAAQILQVSGRAGRQGMDKISSSQMSLEMGLNASQIRRDLNCFGGLDNKDTVTAYKN